MRHTTRRTGTVVLAATLALSLAACSSGGTASSRSSEEVTSSEPVAGGTLTYATDVQPQAGGLDPYVSQAFANFNAIVQIYEPLLAKDNDGEIIPALAESWEQVDDTTFTFALRPGVTFSDGTPLTADDVVFSINAMLKPGTTQAQNLTSVADVTALDDATVQITTTAPDATLVNLLASRGYPIVSKAWYESTSPEDRQTSAMGTGPFILDTWEDNVSLTYTKNPTYWQEGLPYVDALEFLFVGDETSRASQLRQGSGVSVAWFRDPTQVTSLESEGFEVGQNASTRAMYMFVNASEGPLADVRVRQAVSKAMDRQMLIDLAMSGKAEPSLVVPAGDPWGITPDASTPNYTTDVEGAEALLEEAGQPAPTISLTYASDAAFALDVPMIEVLQGQLAEAGITLELNPVPWSEVIASYVQGTWTDLLLVPGVYQPDPAAYFATVLTPGLPMVSAVTADSPEVELYTKLRTTMDPAERADILVELETLVAENVDVLIAYTAPQRYEVWSDAVAGYVVDPYTYREGLAATYLVN